MKVAGGQAPITGRLCASTDSIIMAKLGHSSLDILKIDIEGAEYDVIEDMLSSGIRPRQV